MNSKIGAAICAASLVACAFAAPAIAEDFPKSILWKTLEKWSVYTDPSMGNGCYMHANYENGVGLRFGFDASDPAHIAGYITLINREWASLVPGRQYPIQVKFDNVTHSGWATWTATAQTMGNGMPSLFIRFTNPEIFTAAAGGTAMHVAYQGQALINGNLPGSAQASVELVSCQQTMLPTSNSRPADPFRGSSGGARRDPFTPL